MRYRNVIKIFKVAANKAGLDQAQIRTHSGRSTRANEVITDSIKHPDRWTDQDILNLFGWASMDSAKPYINRNDPEKSIAIQEKLKELDAERNEKYKWIIKQ